MDSKPLVMLIMSISFVQLLGCERITNQFGIISQQQLDAAKMRLHETLPDLPTIPGSVLIESIEDMDDSREYICAGYQLNQLFGTNEYTFPEVLDFYSSELESLGWHPRFVLDYARTFESRNQIGLDVSDDYRFVLFGREVISASQSKFKTIFLLELTTPVVLPYPEQCRHLQGQ